MNKQLNKIIMMAQDAIKDHNLQTYWECLHYEVLPFLERLADEEVNRLIQDTKKILEESKKPILQEKMTVEQIIDKFVTPSSHRKLIKDIV